MKKILITGGAGYIGSTVANRLIEKNYSVTIIDSLITGNKVLVPKKARLIVADIANIKKILKLIDLKTFDIVIHLAGLVRVDESTKKPNKYIINNYKKSKIFLNLCFKNNLKKIIFSSSASVYGNPQKKKVSENHQLKPLNTYALTKLNIEKFLISKSKKNSIKYIILRYFNVAGADIKMRSGQISKQTSHLIKVVCEVATGKRKELVINGDDYDTKDGTTIRDYIHVNDLADIHLLSVKDLIRNGRSNIYNCGYGKGYSVKEVLHNLNKLLKKKLKYKIGPRRPFDCKYMVANSNKFINHFSWKPKHNNLKKILSTSLEWENKINKINKINKMNKIN